ncbi:hypothetical protein ACLB2K_028590 [Fragaria x ananassa]
MKSETTETDKRGAVFSYPGKLQAVTKGRVIEYYPHSVYLVNTLDLANNYLSGEMPVELTSLIRYPLPNGCRDNEETPHVPSEDGQDDSELEKLWIISSMVAGFIVGFWGVCGSLVMIKSWRHAYFNFLDKVKYAIVDFVSDIVKHLQWGTVAV